MAKSESGSALPVGNVGLTDEDVYEAMKIMSGYLDITPGDFMELYCHAYRHAVARILNSVLAREIMTTEVICAELDKPIAEVANLMGREGLSGLPITDADHRVVGVLSDKDFLCRMGEGTPENFMGVIANCLQAKGCIALPIRAQKAGDIMSAPAVTVREDARYSEIASLMAEKAINRVPVVDGEGRLVGIVTRTDLITASARNWTCSPITSAK